MTLTCVKLGRAATFMKYLANVVSLMFLPKTLNWSKTRFGYQINEFCRAGGK